MQVEGFRNRLTPLNSANLDARLFPLAFTSVDNGKRHNSLAQVGGRLLCRFVGNSSGGEHRWVTAHMRMHVSDALVNRVSIGITHALDSMAR